MMWKLSLYILYAAGFLFALVSADLDTPYIRNPLNACILTVQSTVGKVDDARTTLTLGILNRFAISNPPVDRLTISDGGTSEVYEEHEHGLYTVGFSVKSDTYGMWELRNIVTKQWTGTQLFKYDLGSGGNWNILSVSC